jgi:hypothetical protein
MGCYPDLYNHLSTRMRSLIYLLVLSLPLISGCGRAVSSSDISEYGVDCFVTNVLAFKTTHATAGDIQRQFSSKRVADYLNGVLFVYSESSDWIQDIYGKGHHSMGRSQLQKRPMLWLTPFWLAGRVQMGTAKGVKSMLHRSGRGQHQHKPARADEPCAQLEFQPTV